MIVSKLMNRNVFVCKGTDSLETATQRLWDHDIGCLVVVDDGDKAVGMVTDRDLLICAHFAGKRFGDIPVSQAMSKELHAVRETETIQAAEKLMKSRQVHRIAILDAAGRPAGILSLDDLALAAGKQREIKPEEVVATLASICQPRPASATAEG